MVRITYHAPSKIKIEQLKKVGYLVEYVYSNYMDKVDRDIHEFAILHPDDLDVSAGYICDEYNLPLKEKVVTYAKYMGFYAVYSSVHIECKPKAVIISPACSRLKLYLPSIVYAGCRVASSYKHYREADEEKAKALITSLNSYSIAYASEEERAVLQEALYHFISEYISKEEAMTISYLIANLGILKGYEIAKLLYVGEPEKAKKAKSAILNFIDEVVARIFTYIMLEDVPSIRDVLKASFERNIPFAHPEYAYDSYEYARKLIEKMGFKPISEREIENVWKKDKKLREAIETLEILEERMEENIRRRLHIYSPM